MQTEKDRIARQNALRMAIDNTQTGTAGADQIVSDAEAFYAFLTGKGDN